MNKKLPNILTKYILEKFWDKHINNFVPDFMKRIVRNSSNFKQFITPNHDTHTIFSFIQ